MTEEFPLFKSVRGKGLLNAILINDAPDSETAWNFCVAMKDNGLLATRFLRLTKTPIVTHKLCSLTM